MSFSFLRQWLGHGTVPAPAIEPSAHPHEAEAQFRLALQFVNTAGQAPEYEQAAQWYLKAAQQNHAPAQCNLASMYAHGQGVVRDEAKSLMWLTRAAESGNAEAQYKLGIREHLACRKTIRGSAKGSRIEAMKWVRLSAAQGYRGAEQACEFVMLDMTREEVLEGSRRVAAFVAKAA